MLKTQKAITPAGDFAAWRGLGFDSNSIIADPLFIDPEKGNFNLAPNSPILRLGFKPIPVELIGPGGFDPDKYKM